MKRVLSIIFSACFIFATSGCSVKPGDNKSDASTEEAVTANTLGGKYLNAFTASSASDPGATADELIDLHFIETQLVKMDISEGYLDGFTDQISGFTSGVKFSPMIGAIPFVGYIFETESPDELLTCLKEKADPAWNICTEADETVSAVKGNLVFFLMCSNDEDQ